MGRGVRGKFMKVCKIRDTSRVTSGSKGSRSMKNGRGIGYSFLSECPAAAPGQHSGTAGEQPQCPLSQADWPRSGVCVQLSSTHGLRHTVPARLYWMEVRAWIS